MRGVKIRSYHRTMKSSMTKETDTTTGTMITLRSVESCKLEPKINKTI